MTHAAVSLMQPQRPFRETAAKPSQKGKPFLFRQQRKGFCEHGAASVDQAVLIIPLIGISVVGAGKGSCVPCAAFMEDWYQVISEVIQNEHDTPPSFRNIA